MYAALANYFCSKFRLYRGQSPFIGYFAGRAPALMAIDPTFVKDILTTNFKNFHDNEFNNAVSFFFSWVIIILNFLYVYSWIRRWIQFYREIQKC